ncbi:TetR/AcrR family transcriptional regulator [Yinghuangia sp. YIM S10712]|uniref:TetR/AcrR family transcriptional regulator n=1 Tax=Yinghuangia sp. YIM S10712 TaxID=3436930 RepID=UPI003F5350EA
MAHSRPVGAQTSKTRAVLLDCAERLMLDEGYAAVTYRSVAAEAEVTAGTVQYYFPTLDELFIALVRDRSKQSLKKLVADLRTNHPLRAVWNYASDTAAAGLTAELMALANHRKCIRSEMAETGMQARELVMSALDEAPGNYAFPQEVARPEVLVFLMTSTPRMIVMEEAAGISMSHAEVVDFIDRYLDTVERS